jgi:outer membrane biosynthesis protein TonB
MPTKRSSSLPRTGALLALGLMLGACTAGGQFDPTELVSSDIFNTKKKIAGDREPVFPQGVPGAETGVPPDLVKGYQPPPEAPVIADNPPQATAKAAAAAEKPKPKPKPRPKIAKTPAQQGQDPVWDQKGAAQAGGRPAQSAWPAQSAPPAQGGWPAPPPTGQGQAAQTNWPAPPPTRQTQ